MHLKGCHFFFLFFAIWLIAELLVNPIGEFPLNDDFGYSHNVYFLVKEGRFDFSDWQAMTLIVQILWGGLVCKIFGFSFTALRISTVFLALMTTWTSFRLFQKQTNSRWLAFGTTLLFLFNPFFFSLANTFMTDVPFLAVFLPGVYCFIKVVEGRDEDFEIKYWLWGVIFSVLATLIRQPGLLLPLAFGGAYFLQWARRVFVKRLLVASMPFVISFIAMKLYVLWYQTIRELPDEYGQISQLFEPFFNGSLDFKWIVRNNEIFFHFGLFALPFTLFLLPMYWKQASLRHKLIAFVTTAFVCCTFLWHWGFLPMGNVFHNLGLGPKTLYLPKLRGQGGIDILPYPKLGVDWWMTLKCLGVGAALLAVFEMVLALIKHYLQKSWAVLFLFFLALSYYAFIILNPYYIDRYTLVLVPLFLMILLPKSLPVYSRAFLRNISFIVFAGILLFSVGATHDYLSWNRARWVAVDEALVNRGVPPQNLLGGTEPEGWFSRPEVHPKTATAQTDTAKYYITFMSETCGSEIEEAYTFGRWLPPGKGQVYLQKEIPKDTLQDFYCDVERVDSSGQFLLTSDSTVQYKVKGLRTTDFAHSGQYSIHLNEKNRFAFSQTIKRVASCQKILLKAWRKRPENTKPGWNRKPSVFVCTADGFYHADEQLLRRTSDGWEEIQFVLHPQNLPENLKKMKLYIWNISGEDLWLDDFSLQVLTDRPPEK